MPGRSYPVRYIQMSKKIIIPVIMRLLTFIILFAPIFEMITISEAESKRIVFVSNIHENKEFYTSFIHSVNRMPVYEYYRIVDGHFTIYKTSFYAYGAGMPDFQDYNQKPYLKDGMVHIDNLNIEMDSFSIFVGRVADHSLNIDNKTYKLSDFIEPGKTAHFKIQKVSLFALLRRLNHE
ncbi:hypothetical protein SAMN02745176_02404 [Lutispora thermophila DSM 19022]|uniref:DUF1850 domain-containing protein n=2 Tax=Lutispora TaxID=667112 RepID=A0A1M6GKV3_9FIRM|nr:hypothetical protein SAMN02745176_02404 [Lutispora thermophila DSM 19022]